MTVVEQEKVLSEKVQIIDDLHHDLDAVQTTLKHKDAEITDLKDKLEESLQKLRECRDKLKENENGR